MPRVQIIEHEEPKVAISEQAFKLIRDLGRTIRILSSYPLNDRKYILGQRHSMFRALVRFYGRPEGTVDGSFDQHLADILYWRRRLGVTDRQMADRVNEVTTAMLRPDLLVGQCSYCQTWVYSSKFVQVEGRGPVCDNCFRDYFVSCASCGKVVDQGYTYNIIDYGRICRTCREDGVVDLAECHRCGQTFLQENMWFDEPHDRFYCSKHSPISDCKPKHLEFAFPALNVRQKEIRNDEIIPITVGHGEVSDDGMREIVNYVYNKTQGKFGYRGVQIHEIQDDSIFTRDWQNKEGNFPKRLAKHLLVEHNMKLSDELMAEIGNIAKKHAGAPGTHYIAITRNLNLSPEEFVNEGSCWWTSESHSRCELKAWYGLGVRTFSSPEYPESGHPVSRAWIVPLAFKRRGNEILGYDRTEALPADGYVLFNAYGIEQLPYARMIAAMTGKSYRKINFNLGDAYINAGGVLIAEQSDCELIGNTSGYIELSNKRKCGCRGDD